MSFFSIIWKKFASTNFRDTIFPNDFLNTKILDFNENSRNSRNVILAKIYTLQLHQHWGWVRSNAGLVLKLQLVIGNLSFIFATNNLLMSIREFIWGNYWDFHTIWSCVLNKNEVFRVLKSHFYLYLTWVNN